MNWFDLVPGHIAREQIKWERAQLLRRVQKGGLTFREIAHRIRRSKDRVRQLVKFAETHKTPPVKRWLEHGGEIAALNEELRKHESR